MFNIDSLYEYGMLLIWKKKISRNQICPVKVLLGYA